MRPELLREVAYMVQIDADYAEDYDTRCHLADVSEQIHQDADAGFERRDNAGSAP